MLDEVAAQRQQLEREWNKPLGERVAGGFALELIMTYVGELPEVLKRLPEWPDTVSADLQA